MSTNAIDMEQVPEPIRDVVEDALYRQVHRDVWKEQLFLAECLESCGDDNDEHLPVLVDWKHIGPMEPYAACRCHAWRFVPVAAPAFVRGDKI